jgi:superkiller protein 3
MRPLAAAAAVTLALAAMTASGCSKAKKESIQLTNSGVKAFDRGQFDAAYSFFERAVEIYPENATAYYQMGLIDYHQKLEFELALKRLEQAKQLKPTDRDILYQLGRLKTEKFDEHEAAVALFDAAIEVDPNYHPAHFYKGLALEALGRFDDADAAYREAVTIDPTYAQGFVALSELYERFEHGDEAKAVYEEGLRHSPGDMDLLNKIGILKMKSGEIKDAIGHFRDVIARDSSRVDSLFNLSFAYVQLKEGAKAIRYLDKYIAMANPKTDKESIRMARALKNNITLELYQ